MNQQFLFLMLGYPGSGKTTAAKILHEQTGAIHLWADHERKKRFTNPTYTHKENVQLYAELNKLADHLLAQGESVVFDTNFNFYKDRVKLRKIADKHGAKTFVVWVLAPKALAKQRATEEAHLHNTRILGDMPIEHFERIARNLQPPQKDETVIELDGTRITEGVIRDALKATGTAFLKQD